VAHDDPDGGIRPAPGTTASGASHDPTAYAGTAKRAVSVRHRQLTLRRLVRPTSEAESHGFSGSATAAVCRVG